MTALSNFHTHTRFCDGKDTPEELVQEALRLGCPALGFSGHAHVPFDDCCMSIQGTTAYRREIARLKEAYRGRLDILCGIEQDYYSDLSTEGYDYVIGSVHYIEKDGAFLFVDLSRESFIEQVQTYYGGDYYAFAEDYYALVAGIWEKTRCRIVGHFDLVGKFNEGDALFDTSQPRYRRAALGALDALSGKGLLFEVNTGAIARGYRKTPYPAPFLLEELIARRERLILSSDCHDKRQLLFGLEAYRDLPGLAERP